VSRTPDDPNLGNLQANLDPLPQERRDLASQVLERVLSHLESLPEQPICGPLDDLEFFRSLRSAAPTEEQDPQAILDLIFDEIVPRSFNTAGPGYLAYIPGGGLFPAALADLIATTTNRFSGVWQAAPGLAEIEACVLDWLRDWMGFPDTTRGILTPGGSASTLAAVICARDRWLSPDIRDGVIYTSVEAHHCIEKAARLAGIFEDRVRHIPVDDAFRMRLDLLEEAVQRDREQGLQPFMIASSAGTTNTGAVDPIAAIQDLCKQESLWHHVDGAYGGFFHLVEETRMTLRGLSEADSLALDPHKGLFLPYGTGALLIRDGEHLKASHSGTASYLPSTPGDEFYDPSQYGPELSRPWRGLRVWLTVQLLGTDRLTAAISEKRDLALYSYEAFVADPRIQVYGPPELSLFPFHVRAGSLDQENELTRELLERLKQRGRVMLSGCSHGGRFLGRVCVLSYRTRPAQIDALLEDSRAILDEIHPQLT
jgi:aromatic-L-amino-acid/L-tryptophan decarboxylase